MLKFFVVLLLCLVAPFAQAGDLLSKDAQAQVTRVEQYLNARTSFTARFLQATEDGQTATGSLLVSRPGKMNLTYDKPLKDSIIADGSFVYMWDGEMENSTTLPLGGSLADLILRANLKLSGDVQVVKVVNEANHIEVALRQKSDPDQGMMTLLFEDKPLLLRGWRVTDAQNRVTTVTLQDVQDNVKIAANSFTFVPPKLGKSSRSDKAVNQ